MSDDEAPLDTVKSVFTAFRERLSHPVTGIFALVWLLWNWRMVFFLVVSSMPADARITTAANYTDWYVGLFWPALTTICYVFTAPLLKAGTSWWNDWVAAIEAERVYRDQLVELQRNTEIEVRSMQSKQPAIKSQQEQIVRNESRLTQLNEEQQRLTRAIQEIAEVTAPDWLSTIPDLMGTGISPQEVTEASSLADLKQKFKRIDDLKKRVHEKFPKYLWNVGP